MYIFLLSSQSATVEISRTTSVAMTKFGDSMLYLVLGPGGDPYQMHVKKLYLPSVIITAIYGLSQVQNNVLFAFELLQKMSQSVGHENLELVFICVRKLFT